MAKKIRGKTPRGIAREINDAVFGKARKIRKNPVQAVKEQSDLCAKHALAKALSLQGISGSGKKAFVELLKEQPDAVNILFASAANMQKAAELLKPMFGKNAAAFIGEFQTEFNEIMQAAMEENKGYIGR